MSTIIAVAVKLTIAFPRLLLHWILLACATSLTACAMASPHPAQPANPIANTSPWVMYGQDAGGGKSTIDRWIAGQVDSDSDDDDDNDNASADLAASPAAPRQARCSAPLWQQQPSYVCACPISRPNRGPPLLT